MKGTPEFKKTKTSPILFKRPDGTNHFLHGLAAERSGDDVTHELFVRLAGAIVANRRPELGRSGPEQ
jgi:hypothetical protein